MSVGEPVAWSWLKMSGSVLSLWKIYITSECCSSVHNLRRKGRRQKYLRQNMQTWAKLLYPTRPISHAIWFARDTPWAQFFSRLRPKVSSSELKFEEYITHMVCCIMLKLQTIAMARLRMWVCFDICSLSCSICLFICSDLWVTCVLTAQGLLWVALSCIDHTVVIWSEYCGTAGVGPYENLKKLQVHIVAQHGIESSCRS